MYSNQTNYIEGMNQFIFVRHSTEGRISWRLCRLIVSIPVAFPLENPKKERHVAREDEPKILPHKRQQNVCPEMQTGDDRAG